MALLLSSGHVISSSDITPRSSIHTTTELAFKQKYTGIMTMFWSNTVHQDIAQNYLWVTKPSWYSPPHCATSTFYQQLMLLLVTIPAHTHTHAAGVILDL